MASLSEAELALVRYHSSCRKTIVHKMTERAAKRSSSPHDTTAPCKVGRPSTSGGQSRIQRASTSVAPKEKVCVFSPCRYEGEEDLHMVSTYNRGKLLINIQQKTTDDRIRTCLSSLHEPGDAHAQEKWYHSSCLQLALRTIPDDSPSRSELELRRRISDVQLIMYVDSCLQEDGLISMTDVNDVYASILRETNLTEPKVRGGI